MLEHSVLNLHSEAAQKITSYIPSNNFIVDQYIVISTKKKKYNNNTID